MISFTREKLRKMLEFITREPSDSDANQERGHAIPFHSDMIFQYNKKAINAKFFQSAEALETPNCAGSVNTLGKKGSSPQ